MPSYKQAMHLAEMPNIGELPDAFAWCPSVAPPFLLPLDLLMSVYMPDSSHPLLRLFATMAPPSLQEAPVTSPTTK